MKHTAYRQKGFNWKQYFLILFLLVAITGCKQKDKVATPAGAAAQEISVTGHFLVVTTNDSTFVPANEEVILLGEQAVRTYFNSNAVAWSNSLALAQQKVDEAQTNYDALYKDDLAKFEAAKQYHSEKMLDHSAGTQGGLDESGWLQKMEDKIRDLHRQKLMSPAKKQLDEAVYAQSSLWEQVNWPTADSLKTHIAVLDVTTTDSNGHFRLTVPQAAKDDSLLLMAKVIRQNDAKPEIYWWLTKVDVRGATSTDVVLNDDDREKHGIDRWIKDPDTSTYLGCYGLLMDVANTERQFQQKMMQAEDGE
ncbi:MAG TPA: hypothetical protein VG347_17570 [Verrucomicrobiae bacterium]|nr:hypothetical protein [Verrucomicrobiae bacterium]